PAVWGCSVLGVVDPPSGCPVLGVVHPPFGVPGPWVWPDRLGGRCGVFPSSGPGVSRHPPGTVADPPRPRLRQWVAVSAASETACRRAAVHLPARWATGGRARHRAATRPHHSHQLVVLRRVASHGGRG